MVGLKKDLRRDAPTLPLDFLVEPGQVDQALVRLSPFHYQCVVVADIGCLFFSGRRHCR